MASGWRFPGIMADNACEFSVNRARGCSLIELHIRLRMDANAHAGQGKTSLPEAKSWCS